MVSKPTLRWWLRGHRTSPVSRIRLSIFCLAIWGFGLTDKSQEGPTTSEDSEDSRGDDFDHDPWCLSAPLSTTGRTSDDQHHYLPAVQSLDARRSSNTVRQVDFLANDFIWTDGYGTACAFVCSCSPPTFWSSWEWPINSCFDSGAHYFTGPDSMHATQAISISGRPTCYGALHGCFLQTGGTRLACQWPWEHPQEVGYQSGTATDQRLGDCPQDRCTDSLLCWCHTTRSFEGLRQTEGLHFCFRNLDPGHCICPVAEAFFRLRCELHRQPTRAKLPQQGLWPWPRNQLCDVLSMVLVRTLADLSSFWVGAVGSKHCGPNQQISLWHCATFLATTSFEPWTILEAFDSCGRRH